ncbi:MAG: phosphotransferase family protein [Alphaproteobacteria bacterium]|nr:phosphotransferase family protein [Alphaproteobacteria bacterium]
MSGAELAAPFARYLAARLPEIEPGAQDIEVREIARIHGGGSRETYRSLITFTRDGDSRERRLILRRDPPSGIIETERTIEFDAYRSFHGTGVPVPEPLFLETGTEWLERPFFVMEEIRDAEPGKPFNADPYGEHAAKVGQQFYDALGIISTTPPGDIPLSAHFETIAPEDCWRVQLDHWEQVIDEDQLEPQPLVRAAIRWMRANPPPPPEKLAVVHGDYRNGNFLVDSAGNIKAILDWELCHLGDPIEDLAWSLDPMWGPQGGNPGGMLPEDEAIRLWEEKTGLKADPESLMWWRLFAAVKGMGIWISSSKEFATAQNLDPVVAFSGWFTYQKHSELLIEYMKKIREARP